MKYAKPEVNALGEAGKLIQDLTKSPMATVDALNPSDMQHQLNPAYDLDE